MLQKTLFASSQSINASISVRFQMFARQQVRHGLRSCGLAIHRNVSRALCLLLVLALFANSTPAAPQVLAGIVSERSQDLGFWFYSSGWNSTLRKLAADPLHMVMPQQGGIQETQMQRDARVARIQVYPGSLTLHNGERVAFTAVPYDANNVAVGGVNITWYATKNNQPVNISSTGIFSSGFAGQYTITAYGAGQYGQVTVTVPSTTSSSSSAYVPIDGDSGGGTNSPTWQDNSGNRRGNPPGRPVDNGAGSGNFQFAAPVLALPGRGLNLSLGLVYNSRLWNKSSSTITYGVDRDWPAPGWTLGFGKIIGQGVYNGSVIVDADGTRHGYKGAVSTGGLGTFFSGHTTDGTFIDYTHETGSGGLLKYANATYPDGTFVEYTVASSDGGALYPSQITDANGNYITITYVSNVGPNIETITDTLGRVVKFYYDSTNANLLTAVTAPDESGQERPLVRLHYTSLALSYAFASGLTPSTPFGGTVSLIDAIYYPATQTGYWFGDDASNGHSTDPAYSSYGMLAKVIEQRNMTFDDSTALTSQGTVGQGTMTQQQVYDYPLSANTTNPLTDAPTYDTRTDTWAGRDELVSAATIYHTDHDSSTRTTTITQTDGNKTIKSNQYSYYKPGLYDDGLIYKDETVEVINGQADKFLQSSETAWQPGAYDSPRPTLIKKTDERNQTTTVKFDYAGGSYNQVMKVGSYDYNGTSLLRETRNTYDNTSSYTTHHVFSLIKTTGVYDADGTRVSQTEYEYDNGTPTDATDVPHHNHTYDPYTTDFVFGCCAELKDSSQICEDPSCQFSTFNSATNFRGNVTKVTNYSTIDSNTTASGAIIENRTYDMAGNLRTAATSCCQQMSFNYTSDTAYSSPASQTRGSASVAAQQMTTSAIYNFSTGLLASSTDANGRTTSTDYEDTTLRPKTITLPTGAVTTYDYYDATMKVIETTKISATGTIATKSTSQLNGRGQVRSVEALGANNVSDFVDTQYDVLGRVWKQSRPYRDTETKQLTTYTYDALGRTTKVEAPDGSTTEASFNEAGRPGAATADSDTAHGQTTKVKDAWGRERWGRTNALGQLVEVVEPNAGGLGLVADGGYLTKYSYYPLGNLKETTQGTQVRKFKYDAVGRLVAQKLAEASATLTNAGVYSSSGGEWSDVFTYDDRSNMTSSTDARGVKTTYSYDVGTGSNIHSDPLNRLQSVSYFVAAAQNPNGYIADAPTVSYQYKTTDDLSRLEKVTTAGVSVEDYVYDDTKERVSTKTVTLTNRQPLVTGYIYDELDRVITVSYPTQFGATSTAGKQVHHVYDVASRLSELKVGEDKYASGINYNAASQTTALNIGPDGDNRFSESYHYDSVTGLLDNQKVQRGPVDGRTTLLDLDYDYLRSATTTGRTGQLTEIRNNLNHDKNRSYTYDALGRLKTASGGIVNGTSLWMQTYSYDRFGNRTDTSATGHAAVNDTVKLELPKDPKAILPNTELAANSEPVVPVELRDPSSRTLSDSPVRAWSLPSSTHSAASLSKPLANADGNFKPLMPEPQSSTSNFIISEFRLRGTNGAADEFIEFYNNTSVNITVASSDSTTGWALVSSDNSTGAKFVIPNGTVIPARGHYLVVGSSYSLQAAASADQTFTTEIPDNSGIALFSSSTSFSSSNVLDAVGFTPQSATMFSEGSVLPSLVVVNGQFSLMRKQLNYTPQDTADNNSDFLLISTTGCMGAYTGTTCTGTTTPLGAPGPENLHSPIARNDNNFIVTSNLDPPVSSAADPNRVRNSTDTGANKVSGTLSIRRRFTNNTGDAVTRLRFRIVDMTTLNYTSTVNAPVAQMRALNSVNTLARLTGCTADSCAVTVQGTTIEQPEQASGGGLNSSLTAGTITLGHPLLNGESINVQWLLGVMQAGNFRFFVSIEAVTNGNVPVGQNVPRDGYSGDTTTTDGSPILAYEPTNNHITTANFVYDAAGNQTQVVRTDGTIEKLRYDAAGRLVQVLTPVPNQPDRVMETTTYGAGSQRLIVQVGDSSSRTYYAWSSDEVIAEYIDSASSTLQWTKSYIYLGARLLATMQPVQNSTIDTVEYHHPDRLGTRLITNPSNNYVVEQATLPFGVAFDAESANVSTTNRRFTSYERSAQTGLDYAINRHYDAVQGRFTQVDPIGAGASNLADPQSLNMYAYCGNDPINRTDVNGLFWGWLKGLAKRVYNATVHALITAVISFVTSGGNVHTAIRAGVADFTREIGIPSNGSIGVSRTTPPFNPNAGSVLSIGVSGLNRYIINNFAMQNSAGDCAAQAGALGISQEVADLIQKVSALEGTSRELLTVTLMNESSLSASALTAPANTNGKNDDVMKWDVGPFQINIGWTYAALEKKEVSFQGGLTKEGVFGYSFYHSDMKTPAAFDGDPLSNGRMAARRLNATPGRTDEDKAANYTKKTSRPARRTSFQKYAPLFKTFFSNCYPK
jgi:RHS repeat-associated protein